MCVRQVADRLMDNITDAERAIASAPGMYGRIWYGQGLAFDEAYMILQEHCTIAVRCPLPVCAATHILVHVHQLVCATTRHPHVSSCASVGVCYRSTTGAFDPQ